MMQGMMQEFQVVRPAVATTTLMICVLIATVVPASTQDLSTEDASIDPLDICRFDQASALLEEKSKAVNSIFGDPEQVAQNMVSVLQKQLLTKNAFSIIDTVATPCDMLCGDDDLSFYNDLALDGWQPAIFPIPQIFWGETTVNDANFPRKTEFHYGNWGLKARLNITEIVYRVQNGISPPGALDFTGPDAHTYEDWKWAPHSLGVTTPESDDLTLRCPLRWPACPNNTYATAHPAEKETWLAAHPGEQCPTFCLDPARYDNSFRNFEIEYTNPITALFEIAFASLPQLNGMFLNSDFGLTRSYPGFQIEDLVLGQFLTPEHTGFVNIDAWSTVTNPKRELRWSEPYVGLTGQQQVTVSLPWSDEYDALSCLVGLDIILDEALAIMSDLEGVHGLIPAVVAIADGQLIVGPDATYDIIFCPSPNIDCNGTDWITDSNPNRNYIPGRTLLDSPKADFSALLPAMQSRLSGMEELEFDGVPSMFIWNVLEANAGKSALVAIVERESLNAVTGYSISTTSLVGDQIPVVPDNLQNYTDLSFIIVNSGLVPIAYDVENADSFIHVVSHGIVPPQSSVHITVIVSTTAELADKSKSVLLKINVRDEANNCFNELNTIDLELNFVQPAGTCDTRGCGSFASCESNVCVCDDGDFVKAPSFEITGACMERLASTNEQRVFWSIQVLLCLVAVQASLLSLYEFIINPFLKSPVMQSCLAIYIPDLVMAAVYLIFQFMNLLRGRESDACTAVAFLTYGSIIASLAGPAVVSFVTFVATTNGQDGVKPWLIVALVVAPWVIGTIFAGVAYDVDLLGSFRGLYCYNTTWNHPLSGGLTGITFIVSTVVTCVFYALLTRHVYNLSTYSRDTNLHLRVVKKGAEVVAAFFLCWAMFAIIGLMRWAGMSPALEWDTVGALVVSFQPIIDYYLLMRTPGVKKARMARFMTQSGGSRSRPSSQVSKSDKPTGQPKASERIALKSKMTATVHA